MEPPTLAGAVLPPHAVPQRLATMHRGTHAPRASQESESLTIVHPMSRCSYLLFYAHGCLQGGPQYTRCYFASIKTALHAHAVHKALRDHNEPLLLLLPRLVCVLRGQEAQPQGNPILGGGSKQPHRLLQPRLPHVLGAGHGHLVRDLPRTHCMHCALVPIQNAGDMSRVLCSSERPRHTHALLWTLGHSKVIGFTARPTDSATRLWDGLRTTTTRWVSVAKAKHLRSRSCI